MSVWARCCYSLTRTGVSDLPPSKFDVTLVQTHTFQNCHSCLFDTISPHRYSTWVPHKGRTAIIFLSRTHTSKGSNELCVNSELNVCQSVAWRRTSSQREGGSRDTVLYVSTLLWEQTAQLCWMHPVCLAIWRCGSNCALHPLCVQQ